MKINLSKYIREVENENKAYAKHSKARATLPSNDADMIGVGMKHIQVMLKGNPHIKLEVAKKYLFFKGFSDEDTRRVLWCGTSAGLFKFDNNFDIIS